MFDYYELLTLKASVEYTQQNNAELNLQPLLNKILELVEKAK
jgi:hypothetical protein